ncbi:MAG: 2-succinyl-5-enolpyruvyl-6-hydroxy-3-cyclohexene-1-carboxylic-acid synthase [Acidimicrobiales bacterium]
MTKLAGSSQATFCACLVDEWVRAGVRHAVICPGSRSTPMALALACHPQVRLQVRLDERSAGFVALGIGVESGLPAVLLTTSGTAAAEVHAAVIEAHQALVPMIVCTADRPGELHGVGAAQTIVQAGLYGGAVRFASDVGVPDPLAQGWWRSLGSRLFAEATASPLGPGPVHLNVGFREPLDGQPGELPVGRPGGASWHSVPPSTRELDQEEVSAVVAAAHRPLFVAGARAGDPRLLTEVASNLGWPLLADSRSGCRSLAGSKGGAVVVAAGDALCRSSLAGQLMPDLVVRFGEAWASKAVNSWLSRSADNGAAHLLVDPFGEWRDPAREVTSLWRADPDAVLAKLLSSPAGSVEPTWASSWASAEAVAQRALSTHLRQLEERGELTEPLVARRLVDHLLLGTLVVSSSMPVRDVEWFSTPRAGYPRVLSNRGANGIDGVASTTIGVATSLGVRAPGSGPVVGLLGDLAFLHDLTAMVRPREQSTSRTGGFGTGHGCGFVVVDNSGGGIFSYLPQASTVPGERFEQLFGTPQVTDVAAVARASGATVTEIGTPGELREGLDAFFELLVAGESALVICKTDRAHSVAVHAELNDAVAEALDRSA